MQVTLQVIEGPNAGRSYSLRSGQVVQVGRTEWAEFCLPGDASLADVHFTVSCTGTRCHVHDLGAGAPVSVNGEETPDADLFNGDRIAAGQSVVAIYFQREPLDSSVAAADASAAQDADAEPKAGDSGFARISVSLASKVCQSYEADAGATALLKEKARPRDFFDALVKAELLTDAITLLAHALPKREAVWWANLCVSQATGDRPAPQQATALDAARRWSAEPNEENRRAAEAAAVAAGPMTAAGCLANAAFFSEGSLSLPDLPAAPPPPGLTAQTVVGAILLAAASDPQIAPKDRYKSYLKLGVAVADGEQLWPGAEKAE